MALGRRSDNICQKYSLRYMLRYTGDFIHSEVLTTLASFTRKLSALVACKSCSPVTIELINLWSVCLTTPAVFTAWHAASFAKVRASRSGIYRKCPSVCSQRAGGFEMKSDTVRNNRLRNCPPNMEDPAGRLIWPCCKSF